MTGVWENSRKGYYHPHDRKMGTVYSRINAGLELPKFDIFRLNLLIYLWMAIFVTVRCDYATKCIPAVGKSFIHDHSFSLVLQNHEDDWRSG